MARKTKSSRIDQMRVAARESGWTIHTGQDLRAKWLKDCADITTQPQAIKFLIDLSGFDEKHLSELPKRDLVAFVFKLADLLDTATRQRDEYGLAVDLFSFAGSPIVGSTDRQTVAQTLTAANRLKRAKKQDQRLTLNRTPDDAKVHAIARVQQLHAAGQKLESARATVSKETGIGMRSLQAWTTTHRIGRPIKNESRRR